eukprot:CAMPEP_0195142578 /NCGR_PEP_ID=MMETSP0448-20130528/164856_1 /TAXON_ID=66468 /ORGANISM="Heterocapsa triquestra, Strain CCMP 448" /LENGTH=104 /DNA_ID=CAMNT_0040180979 /DNA_START=213 /DNA_END=523 /DNA_ORIENTATION=-
MRVLTRQDAWYEEDAQGDQAREQDWYHGKPQRDLCSIEVRPALAVVVSVWVTVWVSVGMVPRTRRRRVGLLLPCHLVPSPRRLVRENLVRPLDAAEGFSSEGRG